MSPHCDGRACNFAEPLVQCAQRARRKSTQARIDLRHKEGHRIPVRAWVAPIRDQQGSVIGVRKVLTARSMAMRSDGKKVWQFTDAWMKSQESNHVSQNSTSRNFESLRNISALWHHARPSGRLDNFRSAFGREAADTILRVTATNHENALRPAIFWDAGKVRNSWPSCEFNRSGVTAASNVFANSWLRRLAVVGDELMVTASLGAASVQTGEPRLPCWNARTFHSTGPQTCQRGLSDGPPPEITVFMFAIIGILVVVGAVMGGYLMEHGNIKVLIQPANSSSSEEHP